MSGGSEAGRLGRWGEALIAEDLKKKGWKIAVSIGAGISLILNLLQIFEII